MEDKFIKFWKRASEFFNRLNMTDVVSVGLVTFFILFVIVSTITFLIFNWKWITLLLVLSLIIGIYISYRMGKGDDSEDELRGY